MRPLVDAPRWILIAALFFAPWFYGGTTEQGIVAITFVVGAATALWLATLPFRRGDLALPRFLWITCLLLVAYGWAMTLNARAIYDNELAMFVPLRNFASGLAGSIDQALSVAAMLRVSALLGALCLVADACRDPRWAMRFCTTTAAAGASVALLGLVQKATRAPMIFWRDVDQPVTTFFGSFFYHGNAGAYLNLTLPLTLAFAFRAFQRREPLARMAWSSAAVMNVVAVFVNTSRAGHVIALGVLLVFGLAFLRKGIADWRVSAVVVLVVTLAVFAVTRSASVDRSVARWSEGGAIASDARWTSTAAAWRALPEAGLSGFGPGTFHVVFPFYTAGFGTKLDGFWRYLHEDYLQTLMEWGVIGSVLAGAIFFGGMAVAWRARLRVAAKEWRPRQRLLLSAVLIALGSVALHALVDFPLQIASIQFYVATYLGICWSAPSWRGATR